MCGEGVRGLGKVGPKDKMQMKGTIPLEELRCRKKLLI
jgi:hypothetical protein